MLRVLNHRLLTAALCFAHSLAIVSAKRKAPVDEKLITWVKRVESDLYYSAGSRVCRRLLCCSGADFTCCVWGGAITTTSPPQEEYCDVRTLENRLHTIAQRAMANKESQARLQAMQQQRMQANGLVPSPGAVASASSQQNTVVAMQPVCRGLSWRVGWAPSGVHHKIDAVWGLTGFWAGQHVTTLHCSITGPCHEYRCRRGHGGARQGRACYRGGQRGDGWRSQRGGRHSGAYWVVDGWLMGGCMCAWWRKTMHKTSKHTSTMLMVCLHTDPPSWRGCNCAPCTRRYVW